MNQVLVKYVEPNFLLTEEDKGRYSSQQRQRDMVPVVPLSALREVMEGLKALDRMCAAHKIQDLDAHAVIQRLRASLGEQ